MISEEEAVKIATDAITPGIRPADDAVLATESDGDNWIVTWERILPPGTRGPDFDAKVTIDAQSGKVLTILSSD